MSELAMEKTSSSSGLNLISTFSTGTLTISGGRGYGILKSGSSWFTPNLTGLEEVELKITASFSGTITATNYASMFLNINLGNTDGSVSAASYGINIGGGSVGQGSSATVSSSKSGFFNTLSQKSFGVSKFFIVSKSCWNSWLYYLSAVEIDTIFGNIGYSFYNGDANGTISVTGSVTIEVWGR